MSVVSKLMLAGFAVAGLGFCSTAQAMPAAGNSVEKPQIELVKRTCLPNGYCFDKDSGRPMASPNPYPYYRHQRYAPPPRHYRQHYREY